VETRSRRDGGVVTPIDELALTTAQPLERALREVEAVGTPPLMLDLHQLSFIDCSGLHVLLRTQSRAAKTYARFVVAQVFVSLVCWGGAARAVVDPPAGA
jgi:anti-anti-sigma factor